MKSYAEIYNDGQYEENNPTWNTTDATLKANWILSLLKKHQLNPQHVCEIGCGNGGILQALSEHLTATHFTGIDISKKAISLAQQNKNQRIIFREADILNPEFHIEQYYDLILTIDLIEHLENYFEYLRKINKHSQYAMFHIPLDVSIWTLFREQMLIESKDRVGHIHNFTSDFILSVLRDMDYEIIDTIYTEPNYEPQGLKAKFIFGLRKFLFRINKRFCAKTIGGLSLLVLARTKNHNSDSSSSITGV